MYLIDTVPTLKSARRSATSTGRQAACRSTSRPRRRADRRIGETIGYVRLVHATAARFVSRLGKLTAPIRMGEIFSLASEFVDMPLDEIDALLGSAVHHQRVGALSIMGKQFTRKSTTAQRRTELYELYLRRINHINTWDLVDLSGHHIVGGYLFDRSRTKLYELARSGDWWERRLAIFATLHFVRKGEVDDTFAIAEILVNDEEAFVNKAVGGLLREAGKKDRAQLTAFLDRHAATAPRVTVRYAIEHFDPDLRQHYLGLRGA